MSLDFLDGKNNDYLIKENSSRFSIDNVKLFNDSGNSLPLKFEINILPEMPGKRYYRVSYSGLFQTGDSMFTEVSKRIFINFNNDRDTIDYTLKTRNRECGSTFEYLKVKYNGVSISSTENTTFIAIKVIKD